MNPDYPNTANFSCEPQTKRQEVDRLVDSIVQLTVEIKALDAKREALRAKLLTLCCPSA